MKVGSLDSEALVFREDVVRVCSISNHLAGLPNPASFRLSKGSLKAACNPRAFAEWSAWEPFVGQCRHNPGNSRASDEHFSEAEDCFSVRRIELERSTDRVRAWQGTRIR